MPTRSYFAGDIMTTADVLIAVSDSILNSIDQLEHLEYNKKGRKYKFVSNNFQRIREEDKHLVVFPQDLNQHMAVLLAYKILSSIGNGGLLTEYPDFCLSVIGVAGKLESNGWYEEENSSVVHYRTCKYDPTDVREQALKYYEKVESRHIDMGLNIMTAAKLNFLHTDHHIGVRLDSQYIKDYISSFYGPDALSNQEILIALKSFVHWGNIKGFLYKLEVPNVKLSDQLHENFASFPKPPETLISGVKERYPSGTSKYSLVLKAIEVLSAYKFSLLIPYPEDLEYDLDWIFDLCKAIENDPIRFHLRSEQKGLCDKPINLQELSQKHSVKISSLLSFISLVLNIFENTGGEYLLQNSKIPKFDESLVQKYDKYYQSMIKLKENITIYQEKKWEDSDIILRLATSKPSLHSVVSDMQKKYITDD